MAGVQGWGEAGPALSRAVGEAEALTGETGRLHPHVRWVEAPAGWILRTAAAQGAELIILGPERRPTPRPAEERTWQVVAGGASCSVLVVPPATSGAATRRLARPERSLEPEPAPGSRGER